MTPTAIYPGNIATDANLKVAANLVQTTLRVGAGASDTILFVQSLAGFTGNCLVSIDNEIIAVSSVTSGMIALNVSPGGRGYDATSAVSHAAGAKVSLYIVAWHHNVLASEVKAIEGFMGPNGQNLVNLLSSNDFVVSKRFDFPAQAPGGTLNVGNNVVTLTPVPQGINGTDLNHYLYISGGTGTAEAVLITGGTAVSGAPSGTVFVNCANTHSGAWTIQTATAGIQEAISSINSTGTVIVIPGNYTIYGTITMAWNNLAIQGQVGASLTDSTRAGMNLFQVSRPSAAGGRNKIAGLYITSAKTTDSVIYIDGQNTMLVRDVYIQGGTPTGITIAANANTFDVYIENVNVSLGSNTTGTGIAILSSGATKPSGIYLSKVQLAKGQIGLHVTGCGGLYVNQSDIISTGTGLRIDPLSNGEVAFLWFSDVSVDTASGNGIEITPTGTGVVRGVEFTRVWSATHTGDGLFVNPASGAVVDGVRLIGCRLVNNQQHGAQIMGGINTHFIDCALSGNSTGNIGVFHGLMVGAGVTKFQVIGGIYGPTDGHLDSQAFGILVTAGASDQYQITNVNCRGNTVGTLNDQGTGLSKIVKDNLGVDDLAINTIASAATINLGNTGQSTYFISGAIAITTIQGGWRGRVISLIFNAAAPGGVASGGNIARTQAAVQYQPIRLQYDGTVWF